MTPFLVVLLLTIDLYMVTDAKDNDFKPKHWRPGPWVSMSRGSIWPKPWRQTFGTSQLELDPADFHFVLNPAASSCSILQQSMVRFYRRMFVGKLARKVGPGGAGADADAWTWLEWLRWTIRPLPKGFLHSLSVELASSQGCQEWPHQDMDESYELHVNPSDSTSHSLRADTSWGILRGLESFTQLVYVSNKGTYVMNSTQVEDRPRFPFRSFLIDTSRHFLSERAIRRHLDLMEINKFNVLHWHVTDDTSFNYQSTTFPNLSEHGSFHPVTHVYTPQMVQDIIHYARLRGIRVIPEFDTPGHTQSWELGQPGLLSPCKQRPGYFGPMDPSKESVFAFLTSFFAEVASVFPDQYIHIGGDEVQTECWKTNSAITEFMTRMGFGSDHKRLQSYFTERLLEIVDATPDQKAAIVWQEVFDNGDQLKGDTIVQVWKNWGTTWKSKLSEIVKAGHYAILSAPWYLNYIKYGSDWVEMYQIDPTDFSGTRKEKDLVLGGGACIWGEFVNSVNLISRSWPRASAVAERLWSPAELTNQVEAAAPRLAEHECRMIQRGYPVEPATGPSYCPEAVLRQSLWEEGEEDFGEFV